MEPTQRKTLAGTVVYLPANPGSKSEGTLPFLYLGKGIASVRLMRKGDNPFENDGLSEYDGKAVEVAGHSTDAGTFVVDEVNILPPQPRPSNL